MNKKIIGVGIGVAAAIAVILVVIIPQLSSTPQVPPIQTENISHNVKLGLVIMPPTQKPTLEEIRSAYAQAASTPIYLLDKPSQHACPFCIQQ